MAANSHHVSGGGVVAALVVLLALFDAVADGVNLGRRLRAEDYLNESIENFQHIAAKIEERVQGNSEKLIALFKAHQSNVAAPHKNAANEIFASDEQLMKVHTPPYENL